ncbi:MAG: guanylate kinase [Chloroflexi bacterium]|nr:guanylate kinase [Chloroflexota bacterium]
MLQNQGPKIFLISGPSGVGKDSIIEELRNIFKDFHFVVTAVTRTKRNAEIDGVNHFFVSEQKFQEMIENDELIEWSKVYGNYYGVPKIQIDEPISKNHSVLLRVDVQGAEKIKSKIPSVISIFIKPESFDQIKKHLSSRGQNSDDDVERRIEAAKEEVKLSKNFDYIITNQEGNIQYVINHVKDIIVKNLEI